MRIKRFTDEPSEGIKVCRVCGFDEREINVYDNGLCAECDKEREVVEANCECDDVVESQFFQDHGCCHYCFFSSETDEMAQIHREILDLIAPTGWKRVEPAPKVFVVRKWVDDTASITGSKIKNYRAFIGSELKKAIDWSIVLADKGQITPFVRR